MEGSILEQIERTKKNVNCIINLLTTLKEHSENDEICFNINHNNMRKRSHIIVHHTAVSRTVNNSQFNAVKQFHINMKWGDIGYNWFIESNGQIIQGRSEHVAGTHTREEGMNLKSIGICLAGDFDKENPTPKQERSLGRLLDEISNRHDIPIGNIKYHRDYTNKSCPGKNITDNWAKDLFLRHRNLGKIFIQVEKNGEAFYMNPTSLKAEYMGNSPADILDYVQKNAVGISNNDLNIIK